MKKFFLLFCSALLTIGAFAEEISDNGTEEQPVLEQETFEGEWTVNVGLSYRDFKKPHFQGVSAPDFTDYVLDEDKGEFVEPTQENLKAAMEARSDLILHPLTFGSYKGASSSGKGSYGKGEKIAPAIGLSKNIWAKDSLDLDLVLGFQAFELDSSVYLGGSGATLETHDYYAIASSRGVVVNYYDWGMNSSARYIPTFDATGKIKMDMDLYVLDLGLSLGTNFDNGARVFVAAGPTLSLADLNSTAYVGGSRLRDDSTDLTLGCYASAGADFWFTEKVGLSAELRYDKAFGQVKTHYVKQELDGFGGQLKLKYRF